MIWMWLSTIIGLVGAELNSEVEDQTGVTPRWNAMPRPRWLLA
jgi:hypothetical protein